MKIKEREANKKRVSGLIRQTFHNVLKCSHDPAEKRPHRNVKYMLMDYCLDHGLDFHTESSFNNGERADFIISDWAVIFEVLNSEDERRFKSKTYPLPVIPVSAKIDIFAVQDMLQDLETCNGTNWKYYAKKYWRGNL